MAHFAENPDLNRLRRSSLRGIQLVSGVCVGLGLGWGGGGGGNSVQIGCFPSRNGSFLTGITFIPLGANSFLLDLTSSMRGFVCWKANLKSQTLTAL